MSRQKRIVITGANGFTGGHACRYFFDKGYHVTAIKRNSGISLANEPWEMKELDLTDRTAAAKLLKETSPDFCLHLAGLNSVEMSWEQPLDCWMANVQSTLNLVEAIRKEKLHTVMVVAGSVLQQDLESIQAPIHPYSLTKTIQTAAAAAWQHLYEIDVRIAKPSNIVGPGPSNGVCTLFAKQIKWASENNINTVNVSNQHIGRDFIDVRDVVKAYDVIMEKGRAGEEYVIASGHWTSLGKVLRLYQEISGIQFVIKSETDSELKAKEPYDSSKLTKLAWKPEIPLKQSLIEVWKQETAQ